MTYIKRSLTQRDKDTKEQRSKYIYLFVSLFLCFFALKNAYGQSGRKTQNPGKSSSQEVKSDIRIETTEVKVPLSAYDSTGKFVDDLKSNDVMVMEEGEPRQVASITREHANIVLIFDLSNEFGTFKNGAADYNKAIDETEDDAKRKRDTMEPIWKKPTSVTPRPTQMEFAEDFIKRMSASDFISVIQYSDKVKLVQDWTNDRAQAVTSIKANYKIGLASRYNEALILAANKLMEREKGRRIILLISDGVDTASKITQTSALTALKKSQATVFVIGWSKVMKTEIERYSANSYKNSKPGYEAWGTGRNRRAELKYYLSRLPEAEYSLRSLAETTGGEIYLPETHDEILKSTPQITTDIGSQYSLTFITEKKASLEDTREIQVLPARAGLTVRSRPNYYVNY